MGWEVAPDRFLVGKRRWLPRWRFRPTERLEDAFRLLEEACPQKYAMGSEREGLFWVQIQIGEATGEACHRSKPLAITLAIARALQVQVDD